MKKEKKAARVGARVTVYCRGIVNAYMKRYNMSEGEVIELVMRDRARADNIQPLYFEEGEAGHDTAS